MIRGSINDEVQQAGYFSLMADETKDLSKQEQLAIVLRYLDKEGTIIKRFLTLFKPQVSMQRAYPTIELKLKKIMG